MTARSGDRCTCGHARQRHHYGRRTKRWGACHARVLGASGPGPHERCLCPLFHLDDKGKMPDRPPRKTEAELEAEYERWVRIILAR